MRKFKCQDGYTYLCPDNCCLFCNHCTDIFWDYTHGIYMTLCDIDEDTSLGSKGKCGSFVEEVTDFL